jgi:hypothetical protein
LGDFVRNVSNIRATGVESDEAISSNEESEIDAFIHHEVNNLSPDEILHKTKCKKRRLPKPNLSRMKVNQYNFLSDDKKRRHCKSKRVPGLLEKVFLIFLHENYWFLIKYLSIC